MGGIVIPAAAGVRRSAAGFSELNNRFWNRSGGLSEPCWGESRVAPRSPEPRRGGSRVAPGDRTPFRGEGTRGGESRGGSPEGRKTADPEIKKPQVTFRTADLKPRSGFRLSLYSLLRGSLGANFNSPLRREPVQEQWRVVFSSGYPRYAPTPLLCPLAPGPSDTSIR